MMEMKDLLGEDTISLGGRVFETTPEEEVTFEQYAYTQKAASDAGMGEELMGTFQPMIEAISGESEELSEHEMNQITEKVLMRAFADRAYLKVLAGQLREVGKEWTPESAVANEKFFAGLKGDDIRKMHIVLVTAVMGFFIAGLRSMTTSKKSSNLPREVELRVMDAILSPEEKDELAVRDGEMSTAPSPSA